MEEALAHRSWVGARGENRLKSNERLEFLGDAVLDLAVARELFHRLPDRSEGELTQLKSLLVSRSLLEQIARDIELGRALLLSTNEEAMGGRNRPSILGDALEAVLGALYLDGGFEAVHTFVRRQVMPRLADRIEAPDGRNYKSLLLEHVQREKTGPVRYRTVREEGPDHRKLFTVEVVLGDRVLGWGRGESKKQAQQEAARRAVRAIKP